MLTSKQARERYGDPVKESSMVLFTVPKEMRLGVIPKKIYCNKALAPFTNAADITKSDSTSVNCNAIYVGGNGNLSIKMVSTGATVIFTGVTAGTVLNLHLRNGRVMAATTATLLVALS
jgi:hypothetical protein